MQRGSILSEECSKVAKHISPESFCVWILLHLLFLFWFLLLASIIPLDVSWAIWMFLGLFGCFLGYFCCLLGVYFLGFCLSLSFSSLSSLTFMCFLFTWLTLCCLCAAYFVLRVLCLSWIATSRVRRGHLGCSALEYTISSMASNSGFSVVQSPSNFEVASTVPQYVDGDTLWKGRGSMTWCASLMAKVDAAGNATVSECQWLKLCAVNVSLWED